MKKLILCVSLFSAFFGTSQSFPNPATLSTGQGAIGTLDPLWLVSPWFASAPPNPIGLAYTPALINNNCAPGSWVNPATLPPPINNGNWITGNDANCANNTAAGYRYFRLTLNLPADCNGSSIAVSGNYILYLSGYVDNSITDVYVNGTPLGISGGNYSPGSQLNMTLAGPWVAGLNYIDILIYNVPNGNLGNPYGLLLVANSSALSTADTDGDGITDINDLCPCETGFSANGCPPPISPDATICQGESTTLNISATATFLWSNGQTSSSINVSPTTTTTYSCNLTYPNGNQELLSTTVFVNPSYALTTNASICAGESYSFANGQYTQTGTYPVVYQTINGCDSVLTLALTVNQTFTDTVYQTLCQGETIAFEGSSYGTTGMYEVMLTSAQGCDSLRVLNLTVLPTSSSSQAVTECGTYAWNGQNYTQSGVYTFLTTNSVGCDSTAQLNLTLFPAYAVTIDTSLCQGESVTIHGMSYSQSGNYAIPMQTINGCDSAVQLNLTVYPIPATPVLSANQPECPGDNLELFAGGIGNATIFWQGPTGFASNETSLSLPATSSTMGDYVAYCVENGCVSATATITTELVYPNDFDILEFPNVLTPNNDFINDDFDLKAIFQSCLGYELNILNRWGNVVYVQTQDNTPFNGANQNGNDLEEGIYFYQLIYKGGRKTGFFHILR
jgi:gliding motility-associated-like protein